MGTENGVVRYNGYETRVYDYSDGLANVDVWELYEDKQQRIILQSIARGMGYIRNNKYKPFYLKNFDHDRSKIMPTQYHEIGDTARFWNKIGSSQLGGDMAEVVGDTVYFHNEDFFDKFLSQNDIKTSNMTVIYIPMLGRYTLQDTVLYKIYDDGSIEKLCNVKTQYLSNRHIEQGFCINNSLITYYVGLDSFLHINFKTCENGVTHFPVKPHDAVQRIQYTFRTYDKINIITNDYIYIYNEHAKLIEQFSIADLIDDPNLNHTSISYLINDPIWGIGVSTYSNGVLLNFKHKDNAFKKVTNNYSTIKHLGNGTGGLSYWWDKSSKELITIQYGKTVRSTKLYNVYIPRNIRIVGNNSVVLLSAPDNIIITPNEQRKLGEQYKHIEARGFGNIDVMDISFIKKILLSNGLRTIVRVNDNCFYGITGNTACLQRCIENGDSLTIELIKEEKYKDLAYDSFNKNVIAYNDDIISFYNTETKQTRTIGPSALKKKGINRVELIFVYDRNNLIIQSYNELFALNTHTGIVKPLLTNYSLEGAITDVTDGLITVGGRFGIGQYRLEQDSLTTKKLFLNIKSLFYNEIKNMSVNSSSILLGTDKGSYEIDLNSTFGIPELNVRHKMIIAYNDTVQNINSNDTITLLQENPFINFDAINPAGYGTLRFRYKIGDSPWQEGDGKNISTYELSPNKHYTIQVIAFDAAWSSKPISIDLFISPHWWQTSGGKTLIILLTLLAISILVIIAIIITRRRIERINKKKNQQRDLELKSIYSQINPHFIFNTLGTAQYFIRKNKTKEAYAHISQFSDLLRAYLKSSRNKYITIREEVENLENYLELQLSRFEQKFHYNITVDQSLNSSISNIPSLLLQPIVENALNHGIFHMEGVGELNISFNAGKAHQIICTIEDNGVGRARSKELRNTIVRKADSYGTILIKELIETFNKYEPIFIHLEYIDKKAPSTGTIVIITIDNIDLISNNDQSNNS